MPEALTLLLAVVVNLVGLGWLALAMDVHWEQVCGPALASRGAVMSLRGLGGFSLFTSLLLCLKVDHASMAVLVWFMTLSGAALSIAFVLTWQARWLKLLVIWMPGVPSTSVTKNS